MTEIKQEGCYHGQEYLINVKIGADSLQIELESKYDAYWWNGSFTAGYLEELTAKTGEQLQFAKFGELIANSLQRPDQGCNFKVLTFQDLEEMRNGRKAADDNGLNTRSSSGSLNATNNGNAPGKKKERRYVIISKVNQRGDQVHYPLSLNAVDVDDINKLKEHARRIKLEVEELREKSVRSSQYSRSEDIQKSTGGSFGGWIDEQVDQLRSENELLKTKIRRVEESSWVKKGVIEMDVVVKTKSELEKALEDTKRESAAELERLQRELEEKEEGLAMSRVELIKLQQQAALASLNALSSTNSSDQQMKEKYRDEIIRETNRTQDDMLAQFRTLQMQNRELQRSSTDVDFYKATDAKQKQRIRQLEIEVDSAVRRVSVSGRSGASSDRLFSPYNRNNSSSSRTSPSNSSVRNSKNSTINYSNSNRNQLNSNSASNNSNNRYNKRAVSMPSKSYSPAPRNSYGTPNQNIYSRLNNNTQQNQQQQQRQNSRNTYQVNNRTSGSSLNNNNKSSSPLAIVKNSINSYANRQVNSRLSNTNSATNSNSNNNRFNNSSNNRLNSNSANRNGSTNQLASRTTPPNRNSNTSNNNNTTNRVNSNTNRVSPQNQTGLRNAQTANRSPLVAAGNRIGANSNNLRTSPTLRQNRNTPAAVTATTKQQQPPNKQYGYQAPLRVSPAAKSSNVAKNNNNTLNNNRQVSPSARYPAAGNNTKGAATNPSPGTRINNYLQSQDQRLFKRIDKAATSSNNNQNVPNQYNDLHLGSNAANPTNVRELNSGLDKLSNLLKMAKN